MLTKTPPRLPPHGVKRLVISTPLSSLRIAGELRDLKAPHVEATMSIDKLVAADLRKFVPDPGLKSDVTGSLVVRGPLSHLQASLMLAAAQSRITGDLRADVSGARPRYAATARLERLDLADLLESKELAGVVADIGGTAAAPRIAATGNIAKPTVGDQTLAGVSARLVYGERRAAFEMVVKQDAAHALNATGSLPVTLAWADGFKAQAQGDLDASIRSTGLDLTMLNALAQGGIHDMEGKLVLDLRLPGSGVTPAALRSLRTARG